MICYASWRFVLFNDFIIQANKGNISRDLFGLSSVILSEKTRLDETCIVSLSFQ